MTKMTPGRRKRLWAHINSLKARLNRTTGTAERVGLEMRISALKKMMRGS